MSFDVERVRKDFPILSGTNRGTPLVFLDSAASAQKPQAVLDAVDSLYTTSYANVHRGVYELSEKATLAFEGVREKVRAFLNAPSQREIVFVRGTTEAINLVATSFGRANVGEGDEVLITQLEHHSNIVPWQMLCQEKGAKLRVAPIDDDGALVVDEFAKLLGPRTKLAAVAHIANSLGTILPVRELAELCHQHEVPLLVDGAQATPHQPVDVQALGCDFYAFSSHKVFGPTGVGVLWGRSELLEAMPPYQGGGDMILTVSFEKTTYADPPHKFEAGTPDIGGVVGFGAALDYVTALGLTEVAAYERELLRYATRALEQVPGLRLIGTAQRKAGVLSFVLDCAHPHDVGTVLDREGVAVRTGHHCAQPVMERFGVPATTRASLALYNTRNEVDALVDALHKVREIFV
jgi:cysteine desulfurase/selenocysteine lyase